MYGRIKENSGILHTVRIVEFSFYMAKSRFFDLGATHAKTQIRIHGSESAQAPYYINCRISYIELS